MLNRFNCFSGVGASRPDLSRPPDRVRSVALWVRRGSRRPFAVVALLCAAAPTPPFKRIAALCAAALLAVSLPAVPAFAADGGTDWDNKRDEARAHASAIKQAWGVLASWIERTPQTRDPDLDVTRSRAPHLWVAGTGSAGLLNAVYDSSDSDEELWLEDWSARGLSFRFCDQVLAVFAEDDFLRGADMATVAVEGGLQIVNGATAEGMPQSGYPDADIPACMGPLPDGHAALVATAIDPFGWEATRRRNVQADWQLDCTSAAVGQPNTVGDVRYSQTVPVELHPWSGKTVHGVFVAPADMERWPGPPGDQASCPDRQAGDTFDFSWTDADGQSRSRSGVPVPGHGLCDPPGPELEGAHMAAAAVVAPAEACRAPTEIKGQRAARWHFFDSLCQEANAAGVSRDASVFLGPADYDGTPQPTGPPTSSACRLVPGGANAAVGCECPSLYNEAPFAASGRKISKHRFVWKEAFGVGAGTGGWEQVRVRLARAGGLSARTNDCVAQNYANCYRITQGGCPSGYTGYTKSKVYHPAHSGNKTVEFVNTCVEESNNDQEDGCNWGSVDADGSCP